MSNALRIFRYGFLIGRKDFVVFWNWKTWLGGWMLRIFCNAATWVLLGKAMGSQESLRFLLIGSAVFQGTAAAGWTVAASTWDRMDGTYPLLVIAPTSLAPIMIGRTSIWFLNGVATSLITFAILIAAFGLPLPMPGALLAPLAVVLICATSYCFFLFLGSLTLRVVRLRNIIYGIATTLMMTMCGVTVPRDFWPPWVRMIANVLPVTHGLQSVRLLLSRGDGREILQGLIVELLIGVFWLGLAIWVMDRLADAGRADGSIEYVS
jgi:ABC-2 type transport system permease protein